MKAKSYLLLVPAGVIADQAVKAAVEWRLDFETRYPVLPFLDLYRTWNKGIAFSFLSGLPDFALIALTCLIIGFVLFLWWKTDSGKIYALAGFALVASGAAGNLIDRVLHGYVIDYVLFHTPIWSFAVFNLADVLITFGAGFILLQEISDWRSGNSTARNR